MGRQEWGTLQDRIRWILMYRLTTATGEDMGLSALSLAAGLSRSHIGVFIGDPRRVDLTTATARAIAYAGQVSLAWLQTGEGAPNDPDIPAGLPKRVRP